MTRPETPAEMLDRVLKLCKPGPYQCIGGESDRLAIEWTLETRGELLVALLAWSDWANALESIRQPGDPLHKEVRRVHGARIDATRAVIAKATGNKEPTNAQ